MMLTTILLIFSCPWKGKERELFCRVDMTDASKTIGFVADKLSDAEIASPSLKRASFGAAYANHWGKIPTPPTSPCGVLWEVEPKLDPPAEIKPIKPKLWLLGKTELAADTLYRISP